MTLEYLILGYRENLETSLGKLIIHLIYILVASALLIRFLVKQRNKLIQQQKAAAQERKIANELRELHTLKDEFLANTSHELRTPLNGVIGLSETLIIDPLFEQSNEAKESLEAI